MGSGLPDELANSRASGRLGHLFESICGGVAHSQVGQPGELHDRTENGAEELCEVTAQ